jgi:hypothetical protein
MWIGSGMGIDFFSGLSMNRLLIIVLAIFVQFCDGKNFPGQLCQFCRSY